jgi:hypothetical protein
MRLRRAFCLLALVLAACEARDGRTDAPVNLGVGASVEVPVAVDQGNQIPDSDPAPTQEASEAQNVSNVTTVVAAPASVPCGQSRVWTETYGCPGPCIQSFGQAGCVPTMNLCTRTVSIAPVPCPVTAVVPVAARTVRNATPADEAVPNTQ